jgi:hypothetical protein
VTELDATKTIDLARSVVGVQATLAALEGGPPWTDGWTLHMHPKTWYALVREDVVFYRREHTHPVRGENAFLGIPVVQSPDWPEESISIRYEEVLGA